MVDPHISKGAANKQLAPPQRKARAATEYNNDTVIKQYKTRANWIMRPYRVTRKSIMKTQLKNIDYFLHQKDCVFVSVSPSVC